MEKKEKTKKPANSGGTPAPHVERNAKGQLMPGSHLNPYGPLPGYKHLTTQLKEMLFEQAQGSDQTHATLLNKRILKKSIVDGDMRAIELIYDRIEGPPVQETRNVNLNIEGKLGNVEAEKLRQEYEDKLKSKLMQ